MFTCALFNIEYIFMVYSLRDALSLNNDRKDN